eukprot:8276892-Pyramimonas_sp.AAC.1
MAGPGAGGERLLQRGEHRRGAPVRGLAVRAPVLARGDARDGGEEPAGRAAGGVHPRGAQQQRPGKYER